MTIKASTAAKKICEFSNWNISNLKLQKILYIAHKVYMGRNNGEPLVKELFEAWDYGPVIPALYHELKMFGKEPIQDIFWDSEELAEDSKEYILIKEACEKLLPKTAGELVAMTHKEGGAWEHSYAPGIRGIDIPNAHILKEYRVT